jgi:hypothetical protein
MMKMEVASFVKKKLGWEHFLFSHKTEGRVVQYLKAYIQKKYP